MKTETRKLESLIFAKSTYLWLWQDCNSAEGASFPLRWGNGLWDANKAAKGQQPPHQGPTHQASAGGGRWGQPPGGPSRQGGGKPLGSGGQRLLCEEMILLL